MGHRCLKTNSTKDIMKKYMSLALGVCIMSGVHAMQLCPVPQVFDQENQQLKSKPHLGARYRRNLDTTSMVRKTGCPSCNSAHASKTVKVGCAAALICCIHMFNRIVDHYHWR